MIGIVVNLLYYYVSDLESYENNLRGIYFDIRKINCGLVCKSEEELYNNLDVSDTTFYEEFYNKFCSIHNGESTNKVIDFLMRVLAEIIEF